MHPTAAFLALVLGGLSTPLPSVPQEADNPVRNPRPNLVVFLVDDLGWQDLSLPLAPEATAFNDRYRTPNVERLAATGVSFTSAYASAVCSPTRTSLLTGLNAARHRVTNWTLRVGRDPSQTARGLRAPEWRLEGWQPGGPTLPGLLSDAGYTTIHVGKAHWGAKETAGEDPRALGFDVSIGGHAAGGPGSYHGEHDYSAAWRQADRIWDVPDLEAYHGSSVHLTEALTLEAVGAVEQAVRNDRPFFLHLAHYAVHAPFEEHAPWVERYRAQGLDETEARYASMIEGMDASLGALLFALDRLGVAENTLILFLSDNGGLCFAGRGRTPTGTGNYTHNAPLRSGKGSAYEGGTRIPMVVSWARLAAEPRGLQAELAPEPGSRCDRAVHVDDILPTLCALAGVTDLETVGSHPGRLRPLPAPAGRGRLAPSRAPDLPLPPLLPPLPGLGGARVLAPLGDPGRPLQGDRVPRPAARGGLGAVRPGGGPVGGPGPRRRGARGARPPRPRPAAASRGDGGPVPAPGGRRPGDPARAARGDLRWVPARPRARAPRPRGRR